MPQVVAVTIDWVPVGNAGNANDPATGNLYGGVAYNYSIDKYDVTVGQYTEFLNAVAGHRHLRAVQPVDGHGPQHRGHLAQRLGHHCQPLQLQRDRQFGQPADHLRQLGRRGPVCQLAAKRTARPGVWGVRGHDSTKPARTRSTGRSQTALAPSRATPTPRSSSPAKSEWYKAAYYNPTARRAYITGTTPPARTPRRLRPAGQHAEHGELL